MKRPMVAVALFYTGGLLLAEFLQPPLVVLFCLGLAAAVGGLLKPVLLRWLLCPLLVLSGWTNLVSRTAVVSPHDLRHLAGDGPRIVTLRGVLPETPSQRISRRDEREFARSLSVLEVSAMREEADWQPAHGRVLVLTSGILPTSYFAGETVEVSGVLAAPPGPTAEGLFDYRAYLRRQGIYHQLRADSTNEWRLISGQPRPPVGDRFLAWAQDTLARGLPGEDDSLHLLWAMTLGWKTGMTNEVYEPFMKSGTMHIFAISGLHIALIAGILASLLRVLQVSRAWCGLIIVPLIWFYTGASGWQPSAIRSTVMMTIIIVGWSLKRPSDLINSLAAAALIILLWDPQQLFGASFQLSFFVVLSIALLMPPLERVRDRLLQGDPLLPPELVPIWLRAVRKLGRELSAPLATSLAAWLGSLPITAYYFHLFSPVTLLANLVIVPLSGCALACNLGSLLCGSWCSWATELFNHSAWWWMYLMVKLSYWSTLVPQAFVYVHAPSAADFVIYYVLLLAILSGWLLGPGRRRWLAAAAVAATGFYLWEWHRPSDEVRLTVLPLKGAHAVYIAGPGKPRDLLMDCGTTNAVEFVTAPFLHAQAINHLPALLLTHGDLRHMGGARSLAELFAARKVYAGPLRFRSAAYRGTLAEIGRTPGRLDTIGCDDRVGEWRVLHPDSGDRFRQADDGALVLAATFWGTRVLLLSDLGRSGQYALLERLPELRADIVITGLPASGEPVIPALLERLRPKAIIVADSEYPARERASPALRQRLAQLSAHVIYTRTAGAVTVELAPSGWEIRAMEGTRISGTRAPGT